MRSSEARRLALLLMGEGTSGESETSYPHLPLVTAGLLSSCRMECPKAVAQVSFPFIREFNTHFCSPSTRHCASAEGTVGKGIWQWTRQMMSLPSWSLQSSRVDSPKGRQKLLTNCIKRNEGSKHQAETGGYLNWDLKKEESAMFGVEEHWKREENARRGKACEGTSFLGPQGTWNTQDPEGSQMPGASGVEFQGKGAVVCGARSWEALWTLIKNIRSTLLSCNKFFFQRYTWHQIAFYGSLNIRLQGLSVHCGSEGVNLPVVLYSKKELMISPPSYVTTTGWNKNSYS